MINRRKFLKTSLSALAFAAIPKISFSQSNPDVVVIGGGSSGLSVTAELMKKGKSVLCVDAMSRKGGRCFTNTSIFGVPYDLGAHWLHNFNFNQIAQYGKKQKDIFDIFNTNSWKNITCIEDLRGFPRLTMAKYATCSKSKSI